ncbi:MAG: ATP-binding protein [Cyclobacteriaceae bacterium]|nr:ATP-binding protein [Cyclobacteriaceae bacterium]
MKYKFTASCSKDQLKGIRSFVNDTLMKHGLSDIDISTLVLAIDEVCANLMIHAHQCNPDHHLDVEINIQPNKGITFNIIDQGIGFDINTYNEPSVNDLIERKRKGGIGLILVKKIMDDIQFVKINNKNTCKLFKKLSVN